MATAKNEVVLCKCGHSQEQHPLAMESLGTGCLKCSCQQFVAADCTTLREGETRRRLTED